MTLKRVLIFLSVVLLAGLVLHQCWQGKSQAERWFFYFERMARDYAGRVLGPERGTSVPVPKELAGNVVEVHEHYVTFSPKQDPGLVLAFAPEGKPPVSRDGRDWTALGNGWYQQQPAVTTSGTRRGGG